MRRFLLLCLLVPAISLGQARMGDADCDGSINIGDAVSLVEYIFKGGEAPCELYLPTVAENSVMLIPESSYPPGEWANVLQLTIDVPTNGVVYLIGHSRVQEYSGAPVRLGFDSTAIGGSVTYPNDTNPLQWLSPGDYLHSLVPVSGGVHTFYLNLFNGNEHPANCTFHQTRIIATFYPNPPETKKR